MALQFIDRKNTNGTILSRIRKYINPNNPSPLYWTGTGRAGLVRIYQGINPVCVGWVDDQQDLFSVPS